MNIFLEVSAALGGLVVFMSAVVVIVKAVFKQTNTMADNTKALEGLIKSVDALKTDYTKTIDELKREFARHGERIAKLEAMR